MAYYKSVFVALLSLGSIVIMALPGMARPATIANEANIRSGPSTRAERIDGLPQGTPLEILKVMYGIKDNVRCWYYVRSTGDLKTVGWVASTLVDLEPSDDIYAKLVGGEDSIINIRSAPNINSRILHTGVIRDVVKVGKPVKTKDRNRDDDDEPGSNLWYPVTYPNGAAGWIRGDSIYTFRQGSQTLPCTIN